MIVKHDNECLDRVLCVQFNDVYENYTDDIYDILHDAYKEWVNFESIEDEGERDYVQYTPLETYMIDYLSVVFNQWDEWWVEET